MKKGMSFANFWPYNRLCTQPIAKKKKKCWFVAHIYTTSYQDHFIILPCALYFKLYNFIKCSYFLFCSFLYFLFFSLYPNICFNHIFTMLTVLTYFIQRTSLSHLTFFCCCHSRFMSEYSCRKYRREIFIIELI